MEVHGRACKSPAAPPGEEDMDLRRGPWTTDEDHILMNYITNHGEGRWNSLSRCAGLKRTGKSCRLRWLNYLRPDVRRGNITPEEQLLILELHSRWGNRWSKIAQHLPGRTDNEIKNYWRTRVQKHAKQLHCDVNSKQFQDVMRYLWMPRLLERIHAASTATDVAEINTTTTTTTPTNQEQHVQVQQHDCDQQSVSFGHRVAGVKLSPESCSMGGESSSESAVTQASSSPYVVPESSGGGAAAAEPYIGWCPEVLPSPGGFPYPGCMDFGQSAWGDVPYDNIWDLELEDIWSLQQHL